MGLVLGKVQMLFRQMQKAAGECVGEGEIFLTVSKFYIDMFISDRLYFSFAEFFMYYGHTYCY